jgi:hypothetical protein
MLKAANLLHYPADPLVLDSWELENVFDAEFGHANGWGKTRREEIRREHEAFWSTGVALYLNRRLWRFTALNSWTGGLSVGLNSWKHCT